MRNVLTLFIVFFLLGDIAIARLTAKITVKANDEQNAIIEGAKVSVGFVVPNKRGIGTTEIHKDGYTDKNGEFTTSSESMNLLGFSVDKDGYYQSGSGYQFTSSSKLLNRWEPWNPTIEVVLKKKRNPVPMYINGGIIRVPKFDEPIGYDLEKGDWVAPYGRGIINDLMFTYHAEMRAYREYECSFVMSFSNENDGIQEFRFDKNDQSYFKWPFEAPEHNYTERISRHEIKEPGKNLQTDAKSDINYIFRVRTKVDSSGKIIDAKYGKIEGEFGFDPKGNIQFYYYFNPDGTRNLEEDPEKNLFDTK